VVALERLGDAADGPRLVVALDDRRADRRLTAARPPGFSSRRKSARKSSSVFFVLTI
jgi:hypothetical protein